MRHTSQALREYLREMEVPLRFAGMPFYPTYVFIIRSNGSFNLDFYSFLTACFPNHINRWHCFLFPAAPLVWWWVGFVGWLTKSSCLSFKDADLMLFLKVFQPTAFSLAFTPQKMGIPFIKGVTAWIIIIIIIFMFKM